MNVLSLFDGISCGMVALERDLIPVDRYVAYEIDENAIKVSSTNYPQIEHMGSVIDADFTPYEGFDLLIGGSPCQNLSCMGNGEGLWGEESSLFFEYVRALKEVKPKWFLLENNASMSAKNKETISKIMGCEPVYIDSKDFSAQNRKRLYWTNIPVADWTPLNITLGDIIEPIEDKQEYLFTEKALKYLSDEYKGRKIQNCVRNKIKTLDQQSRCLGTYCGDYGNNTGLITLYPNGDYYSITPIEAERLQTLPDNYTACIPTKKRFFEIGNGWTVDVIAHIFKGLPRSSSWLDDLLNS